MFVFVAFLIIFCCVDNERDFEQVESRKIKRVQSKTIILLNLMVRQEAHSLQQLYKGKEK